ncbi:MAG: SDR family oxidoreductase [Anaerolineae bacterium]|nr:SDR family oxidoreductase [Anaerolineae bacterium]
MDRAEQLITLITGAGGNLGQASARVFAAAGARLALVEHSLGRLEALFPQWVHNGVHLLLGGVDVGDPPQMQAALERILAHFGRVDVLINTVGGYAAGKPLHEMPLEQWDTMMNLNARTLIVACQAVIPVMLRQKFGRIINISSGAALAGSKNAAAYSAAKSAVIRLTESMAAELKGSGINVNCILPGTIDTPQNRQAMPDADFTRWVQPESLAEVILFLASPAARDITGAALPVPGSPPP